MSLMYAEHLSEMSEMKAREIRCWATSSDTAENQPDLVSESLGEKAVREVAAAEACVSIRPLAPGCSLGEPAQLRHAKDGICHIQ